MSIRTKYYYGSPGAYGITDSQLVNTEIFCVTRSGSVYNQGTPVEGLTFGYQDAFGRILFGIPFYGPVFPARPSIRDLEKISVKFRE